MPPADLKSELPTLASGGAADLPGTAAGIDDDVKAGKNWKEIG